MRFRLIGLIIALMVLFSSAAARSDLIFSRKADLGPVELSHGELYLIVEKIRDAVSVSSNHSVDERINIAAHDAALDLPGNFTKEELARAPVPAYSVKYTIAVKDAEHRPLFSVFLWLDDDRRLVEVSGDKQGQVDGVFALVIGELEKRKVYFGGDNMRLFLMPIALSLFYVLALVIFWFILEITETAHVMAIGSMLVLGLSYPWWGHWFPGTLLYDISPSLMDRYAIAFWLAGLVVPFAIERTWRAMRRRRIRAA